MNKNVGHTMTNTEIKLKEAKYFLLLFQREMKLKSKKSKILGKKQKRYSMSVLKKSFLLNAYINSARNILWVMKAEFSKNQGWREWYELKVPTDEEADIFQLFTNLRNKSVKIKSLNPIWITLVKSPRSIPDKKIKLLNDFYDTFKVYDNEKIAYMEGDRNGQLTNRAVVINYTDIKNKVSVEGYESIDNITNECIKYYGILEGIVIECLSKFSKNMNKKSKE